MDGSKRYHLNKKDGGKILKGAGMAGGGAVTVYLLTLLPEVDFGTQTPFIAGIAAIVLNAVIKFFKDNNE